MHKIGYSLVEIATGAEIRSTTGLPVRFVLDGIGTVDFDKVDQVMPDANAPTHVLVERWATDQPSPLHTLASEAAEFNDVQGLVLVTRTWNDPPALTQADLHAYLATKRYAVETGGMVLNGTPLATDRESKSTITAAYVLALQDPNYTIPNWKVAPGIFITLDNATIVAIGNAVSAFVQDCFDKEAELAAAIVAATVTTYSEIDNAAWPTGT